MKIITATLLLAACATETTVTNSNQLAPPSTPAPPTTAQAMGGLGVVVTEEVDRLVVARVMTRSPACHAGLHAGDVIVKVDGRPPTVALLRGAPGSAVTLGVERGGASLAMTVTRALIDAATVHVDCVHPGGSKLALAAVAGDLDGDSRNETITLLSNDATVYWHQPKDSRFDIMIDHAGRADLRVGSASWPIDLAVGDVVGLRVIDIDATDTRREVLVMRRAQGEDEVDIHVFVFDGARLHPTTLARGSWTHVDGKGALVVEHSPSSADVETRIEYRVRGSQLVEHARTHRPVHSD